jgi:hypothetical protein
LVYIQANQQGLTLLARLEEVALRWHQPGALKPQAIGVPGELLDRFEGAGNGSFSLEQVSPSQARVCWQTAGVPQEHRINTVTPDGIERFPTLPEKLTALPDTFLGALAEAVRTTSRVYERMALSRLQLRGSKGQVVSTDGRQLLIQGGFDLPWKEDLLIASLPAFASRELRGESAVTVGHREGWVTLQLGAWMFQLAIDTSSRYPNVEQAIPKQQDTPTRLCLDSKDSEQLKAALPQLPGKANDCSPVTVDLNSPASVRAREPGQETVAEVVLARSSVSGPPICVNTNRLYLLRALQLGFQEVHFGKPSCPAVCRDAKRIYLWMLLDPKDVVAPTRQAMPEATPAPDPSSAPLPPSRKKPVMPRPRPEPLPHPEGNGNGTSDNQRLPNLDELIGEAEAIRAVLSESQTRLGRLVAALKQHRRQARLVQAAVESIKHL